MIGTDDRKESGNSVLSAELDDDDNKVASVANPLPSSPGFEHSDPVTKKLSHKQDLAQSYTMCGKFSSHE